MPIKMNQNQEKMLAFVGKVAAGKASEADLEKANETKTGQVLVMLGKSLSEKSDKGTTLSEKELNKILDKFDQHIAETPDLDGIFDAAWTEDLKNSPVVNGEHIKLDEGAYARMGSFEDGDLGR